MGLQVCIDGSAVEGLLQATFASNNYFSSDSFSLTLACGQPPMNSLTDWSQLSSTYVEVSYSGSNRADPITIITGMADSLVTDPILGTTSLEGRDLSAGLIDSYPQRNFANQTASEIVEALATQQGLSPEVTLTWDNIGRYFGDGYKGFRLVNFRNSGRTRISWFN